MKDINKLVDSALLENIRSFDKLSQTVYELLHLNQEKHNIWVVIKQQQLTLLTDNPYLATQLQYQQQNICTELNRKHLLQLKTIKIKIVPPKGNKPKNNNKCFQISENAKKVLAGIANDIEDESLRKTLLTLTKTVKN